jgi:hypothetical protein
MPGAEIPQNQKITAADCALFLGQTDPPARAGFEQKHDRNAVERNLLRIGASEGAAA